MTDFKTQLMFDQGDLALAAVAGHLAEAGTAPAPELHPRGIVELAEARTTRMVRSMHVLLQPFDPHQETIHARLRALRVVRDELIDGLDSPLRYNTARVALELLKRLLRADSDLERRQSAHDLRSALLGNPLFIRKQLQRFNLVEMPESTHPVTFDQHVHDANTKGRKSPVHLVMDAWIKGVWQLHVIYYNFVPRQAVEELLHAAQLLGIEVRIGVEFRISYRGRVVEMIWTPIGFTGVAGYLRFLDRNKMSAFTRKCLKASEFRKKQVLTILDEFNRNGRVRFNEDYRMELKAITHDEFLASVRYGQPSVEHIGELLAQKLHDTSSLLIPGEELCGRYVDRSLWFQFPAHDKLPELCRMSPRELCDELHGVAAEYQLTLNMSYLALPEIIEIVYDCGGEITHLEIFNLKDELDGTPRCDEAANELRHALNHGHAVALKNIVREAIATARETGLGDLQPKLYRILHDLPGFSRMYEQPLLRASLGSDSTSRRSRRPHAMGLLVLDSLPWRIRHSLLRHRELIWRLPIRATLERIVNLVPHRKNTVRWECVDPAAEIGHDPERGNVVSLGAIHPPDANERYEPWRLNSRVKIFLKIALGFAAAFYTFYWTSQSSHFLMYFGAVIWLGITLVRNVIQAGMAAEDYFSSFRKWKDFVSWQRIADSLMYTGLSVPLLDYVVRKWLLGQVFGLTVENNALMVFAGIAVANGFYISGHNLLRAFPKSAVWGNWLRAPLSIPLAMLYNTIIGTILHLFDVGDAATLLQSGAAITSKLAGDTIGGVIEAVSDRKRYRRARQEDFTVKMRELYELTEQIEILLPDENLAERLRKGGQLDRLERVRENKALRRALYINALDMMYLYLRQPQARCVLKKIFHASTPEEQQLFISAQSVLRSQKSITKLFDGGVVGDNVSPARLFYLHHYESYLDEINALATHRELPHPTAPRPKTKRV